MSSDRGRQRGRRARLGRGYFCRLRRYDREARDLAKIRDNINVKIPLIEEGLRAVRLLHRNIFGRTSHSASIQYRPHGCKSGRFIYISFIGRLDDISAEGMDVVEEIAAIFDNYDFDTEIIVASIRNPSYQACRPNRRRYRDHPL